MEGKDPDNIKLAVLEEKVINMVAVISKLDDTIEKLSDLSVNVSKMLAVHEEKLEVARESAAESAREITLLETKVNTNDEKIIERVRGLERRVWMAMGMGMLVVIFLQLEMAQDMIFPNDSDIIEEVRIRD